MIMKSKQHHNGKIALSSLLMDGNDTCNIRAITSLAFEPNHREEARISKIGLNNAYIRDWGERVTDERATSGDGRASGERPTSQRCWWTLSL